MEKGLHITGLTITPLNAPARLLKPEGHRANGFHADVRTLIGLNSLLGRRGQSATVNATDFQIDGVRKTGSVWEVKFKEGLVFHTGEDTTTTPVRVYTEATGTGAWIAISDSDMAWVVVTVDNVGAVTSAALATGATLPATVRHNPPINGTGGNTGSYVYKLATFSIVDGRLSHRMHHVGAIEVDYRFLLSNVGGGSKIVKKWNEETGELYVRTLNGGTDIEVVEGEDTLTINYTGTTTGWWGKLEWIVYGASTANDYYLGLTFENGILNLVEYGASSGASTPEEVPGTEETPGYKQVFTYDT